MRKVKKFNMRVKAFELGKDTPIEKEFIASGKIIKHREYYEIFSKESGQTGQFARIGDFVKIDNDNDPYPNKREDFLSQHNHIEGYYYVQIPRELLSWTYEDDRDDIIKYLLKTKKLLLDIDSENSFYQAKLWGTILTAKKDDIILVYNVTKADEKIISVDFNLVDKGEFNLTYEYM